ncbi:hypothetical protein QBC47DRAFT_2646 [Echria macrotheca]|uniref:Nephrocystin 3-like N-terminal domain-containing protein n=1 Tax=Echria macrotheca TaxID=438768 RepID=A0AAJ0BLP2_9PEZI|nr:hypothetical protein QBC47DRAFT_2646 [Echria macrotheca]
MREIHTSATGLPQHGKSTLLKFIAEHERLEPLLREWADTQDIISAHFFFWGPGTADQKSLRGLVRGLLFAVIQQEPDLVGMLFPRLWTPQSTNKKKAKVTESLTDPEIYRAFENVVNNEAILAKYRVFFLVDVLDEFEETRDISHYSLAMKLKAWAWNSNGNVKICVSSRELTVSKRPLILANVSLCKPLLGMIVCFDKAVDAGRTSPTSTPPAALSWSRPWPARRAKFYPIDLMEW